MKRTSRRVICVIALGLALAGCAVDPVGGPDGDPLPSDSPTVEAAAAAEIILTGEGLELLDSTGGTLGSIRYTGDTDAAIDLLTTFFGADPVQVPYVGGMEDTNGTDYTWGGFTYRIRNHAAEPEWYNQQAVVNGPLPSDIDIHTEAGLEVGAPGADALALAEFPSTAQEGSFYYQIEPYDRPDSADPADTTDLIDYVVARVSVDTDEVTMIWAPSGNYGV